MCGIAGFLGLDDEGLLARMVDCQAHRGPDDRATWRDGRCGLGYRRLAIIDVAGGQQPIHTPDGDLTIVYNGELYNYLELRAELERAGHRFHTKSDTEVVLHAWQAWGLDGLAKLNGMFAFAIWHRSARRLVLVRDHLGVKPLHYAFHGGALLFGSELKAILQHREVPRALHSTALDALLTFRYNSLQETLLAGIHKMPPGHALVVDADAQGRPTGHAIQRYWDVRDFTKLQGDEAALAGQLRALLEDAVRRQLMSEVPLGVYLSGGLDSSGLVALMAEHVEEVNTFTVGFGGLAPDETAHAQRVADHFGTNHRVLQVDASASKHLDEVVAHLEEPYADLAAIPVLLMSRAAKRDVTVVLTGDGNDEVWGGYPYYAEQAALERRRGALPGPLRRLAGAAGALAGGKGQRLGAALAGAREHFVHKEEVFRGEEKDRLWPARPRGAHPRAALWDRHAITSTELLDRLQYLDVKSLLPDAYLVKADRMTMAASVEGRVPFLDFRLVELSFRVPPALRVGPPAKRLYRAALRDALPRATLERPKLGFNVPGGAWLKELPDLVDERLGKDSACARLFDRAELARLAGRARRGPGPREAQQLWTLLFIDAWARKFLA